MNDVIKVGVGVMIIEGDRILLGHRVKQAADTGGIFEPDTWCLPGGKQAYGETVFEAAIRETKEETNLDIEGLSIFGVADDIQTGKHFVTIHIVANHWHGNLLVQEPDMQDMWQWFSIFDLPANIYSPSKKFIDTYLYQYNKKTSGRS